MSSSNPTAPSEKGGYAKIYRPNHDNNAATPSSPSKLESSSKPPVIPGSYYDTYRPNSDAAKGVLAKKTSRADALGLSEDGYYLDKDGGYRPDPEAKVSDTQEVKHQMHTSESTDGRVGSDCDPDEAELESDKKKQVVYREGK